MDLAHSETRIMYICEICKSENGQVTTLIDHYRILHGKTLTPDEAHLRGQSRPNWYSPKGNRPKVKRNKMVCKCGSTASGSSNMNKHIRNFHKTTNYTDFCE